jgi:starch-binding outer membrane protein, SusD/RagB family
MKIKYLVVIIAVTFLTACSSSFLDVENPNKMTTDTFWQTEDDLYSAIATVYSALVEDYEGYYGTVNWELNDSRTDNFTERNDVRARYEISVFQNTASNGCATSLYTGAYVGIFRANQVIQYGEAMDIDEDVKNQYIAEAKFLRGLNYFNLVKDFGAVPIHTTVPATSDDYYIAKSTVEEVWQQVISDFTEAAKYLPETYSSDQKGRATKGAALAFLGRAYLYRADYANAQTVLKSIVDNESTYGYGLQANYAELFDGEHENGIEGVFELQYSTLGGTSIWTSDPASKTRATFIAQEIAPGEVGGWYEFFPTKILLNKFLEEPATDGGFDPRATATLAWDYPGCKYYQLDFHSVWPDQVLLKKNQNWWNADEGDWKSVLNEYGMRYADVLLMLAESYTMQGNVTAAAPLVNRIRERATLPNKLTAMLAYSATQMMTEIRHQRDLEFAREGLRFYDLRRWGLLEETIKAAQVIGYQNYSSKFEYYPIPESELDNNPNMTQSDAWK